MPGGSFESTVTTVSRDLSHEWASCAHSPIRPLANLRSAICIKKPATSLGSGFVEIVVRRFSSTCQRRKQVQRPATHVVVMPKPSVAVNVVPKHCEALIPDERRHCQIQVTVFDPQK